ncbi:uncharacterized protein HaLaN_08039 [Haematococcus lacustris]|uniref:Uncharacterized protein n=1 Tax=Haematococcus lacustris TaxID=44745 RepID=A0A699Z0D2_HAELA|nr:uncharacterized protein HaLaN_08039 [Haematococcus lacustris]
MQSQDPHTELQFAAECLSVDLVKEASRLRQLLIAADCWPYGGLAFGPYARVAVRRYETLWLPLLAGHAATQELIPPLDVAWAWLCHRLAPAAYEADCLRLFGRRLDPASPYQALAFDDGTTEAGRATALLWKQHQEGSNGRPEPYFPPSQPLAVQVIKSPDRLRWPHELLQKAKDELEGKNDPASASQFNYDVEAAMKRQAPFLRSFLRACYNEVPFLQRAQDRYLRFVLLWRALPELTVVPMYDIDLMWHAHMAHSGAYQQDMMQLAGKLLHHDDSLPIPKLAADYLTTKAAFEARWNMLYDPPLTQKDVEAESKKATKVATDALEAAAQRSKAAFQQAEALRLEVRCDRAVLPNQSHLAGGAALYCLHLVQRYLEQHPPGMFTACLGDGGRRRKAAK